MSFTKRQNQIVEVAVKLIAEHGIQNLTIKNLSEEIGISEPALYRHFKNKFEILNALIDYFFLKTKPIMEEINSVENPILAIEKFIKGHLEIFYQNKNLARIIFSESNFQNEEKLLEKLATSMESSSVFLQNIIKNGQTQKVIRNDISSLTLFRIIVGALRFTVTQWNISQMHFDLKEHGTQLCNEIITLIKK